MRALLFAGTLLSRQKVTKMPLFFKKLTISQKLSFKLFFFNPEYIGQHQDSELFAKKIGGNIF